MSKMRPIQPKEKAIVKALLAHAKIEEIEITDQVSEYGDPYMGSINFDNNYPESYAGDIAQSEYTDADGEQVVLSLTQDQEGRLLDLDFWKSNFTPLVNYPTPEMVTFK